MRGGKLSDGVVLRTMRWRAGHDVKKSTVRCFFLACESLARASLAAFLISGILSYLPALARRLLCRAAAFLWIRPLREARSRSRTAAILSSAVPLDARLSAVRSADFWARLRMAAARDFRMFFFAEARFGTNYSPSIFVGVKPLNLPHKAAQVKLPISR